MVNPRNFLLNSEYPMDKVVFMKSGDLMVSGDFPDHVPIRHNLPFTPEIIWSYSTSPGFESSSSSGLLVYGSTSQIGLTVSSDSQFIHIEPFKIAAADRRLYWRAFGFMPPDAHEDSEVPETATESNRFYRDSGLNYLKLLKGGVVGSGGGVVNYDLKYRPRVLVWEHLSGGRRRLLQVGDTNPAFQPVRVTETEVVFTGGPWSYRIYADA